MITITNEMLDKAFGDMRVNGEGELYSWSVEELSKRDIYGKDINYVILYDGCSDPQKYVDNWMNSTLANNYAEEYFKGDDNMNKYETLLKKYGKLCREFEVYKENAEDVAIELIEVNSMYDELKKENAALKKDRENLAQQVVYLKDKMKEKMDKIKQRDKQITEYIRKNNVLKEERDCLLRKIKEESNEQDVIRLALVKERDELKQRLEHINAMSNLEWKFEVVEETETTDTAKSSYDTLVQDESCIGFAEIPPVTSYGDIFLSLKPTKVIKAATPYDELVAFCDFHNVGCHHCPKEIVCNSINRGFRPAKWNEDEIAEYNELVAMINKEDK